MGRLLADAMESYGCILIEFQRQLRISKAKCNRQRLGGALQQRLIGGKGFGQLSPIEEQVGKAKFGTDMARRGLQNLGEDDLGFSFSPFRYISSACS